MELCVQVFTNAATHALSDQAKADRRYINGDIFQVLIATDIATWNGSEYIPKEPVTSPRMSFIFITDAPDRSMDIMKRLEVKTADFTDPWNPVVSNLRNYNLNINNLSAEDQTQLTNLKYITVSMTEAFTLITNKGIGRLMNLADIG